VTDKLSLYNGALSKMGQPRLSALTDVGKARRELDAVYDKTVKACLEAGQWNFAMRLVKAETSPSVSSNFGYRYVFDKPDDWLRTNALSADEYARIPLIDYEDRTSHWHADVDIIYVRYVSNDADFGLDLGRWPESFTRYVELALACESCEQIVTSESKLEGLEKRRDKAFSKASATDAMNEPAVKFMPPGKLVSSRLGGSLRSRAR
jgi:hypothetical protein